MDVMIHAKLSKPNGMSNKEFFGVGKLGYEYMVDLDWTILRPYENWSKHLDTLKSD